VADLVALVSAEVGVVFCTVVLITGPIWARPVWGIWWTWDMRLTSTLVLWLIYVSYLFLRRFSSGGQTPVLAAALAVLGALCVPFVYFSIWFSAPSIRNRSWAEEARSIPACCMFCSSTGWRFRALHFWCAGRVFV